MTSWLDPLIDPHKLAATARRGGKDPRAGLALLLGGELFQYERLAIESEWPRLGAGPRRGTSRDQQLLAAVGLHLSGSDEATSTYKRLLRLTGGDGGFATVVAVLASIELAGRANEDEALDVLARALRKKPEPLEAMVLALHIGVREAERGNTHEAIDATVRARATRHAEPAHHFRALKVIAEYNVFSYRRLVGEMSDLAQLPLRASHLPLVRGGIDLADGLAKYLEEQFALSTRNPYARSITFRTEDPVEVPLRGALLRAECLADWVGRGHCRGLLGRYLVASKLGTADGVPPTAFELFRLAGDQKAMVEATRSVAAIGPLGALRSETQAVVEMPWPNTQRSAALSLLAGGADLLSAAQGDQALSRLRTTADITLATFVQAIRSIARLLRVASAGAQTPTSRFVRELADEWPEPIVLQEMGRVVRALRWDEIASRERQQWLAYIKLHLLEPGDARFLAEAAAAALAATEGVAVAEALSEAYESAPNLSRLALMVDGSVPISPGQRGPAIDEVCRALECIREDANRGRFGIGDLDVARLALYLLRDRPRQDGWDQLADFLLDDKVSIGAKTGAIEELASPETSIPSRIRSRLRDGIAEIGGFGDDLEGSRNELHGASLRLWLKLGGLTRDELLSRLLELAGDMDPEGRREAAKTLPAAQRKLGDDSAFTLALTLTRDRDVSVRAPAGRSLARLRRKGSRELGAVAVRRLESLLEEPGTEVPYWTLAGLLEAKRDGQLPHRTVGEEVTRVRRHHPSRRVQELADMLLTAS